MTTTTLTVPPLARGGIRAAVYALVVLVVAVSALFAAPGTAQAFCAPGLDDGKTPPPASSASDEFGAGPRQSPTGLNPFTPGSGTSVYREYGFVVPTWGTYDTGCGGDVRAPVAVTMSLITSLPLAAATITIGGPLSWIAHGVLSWSFLSPLDQVLSDIAGDLRSSTWVQLGGVVILLTVLYLMWKMVRGEIKEIGVALGYVVCACAALAFLTGYPGGAGKVFDSGIRQVTAYAYGPESGFAVGGDEPDAAGDAVIGSVYDVAVYRTWCWGMVGTETKIQDEYCPRLWDATHLTRAESALSGASQQKVIEEKADRFGDVADDIKDKHPGVYATLQGKQWQGRLGAAGLGVLLWIVLSVYPLMGLVLVFVALMMIRVAVALAPMYGPLLLHPAARKSAQAAGKMLLSAAFNACIFTVATAFYLRVAAGLMHGTSQSSPGANSYELGLRVIMLSALTVTMWIITRPYRRLLSIGRRPDLHIDRAAKKASKEGITETVGNTVRLAAAVASGVGAVSAAASLRAETGVARHPFGYGDRPSSGTVSAPAAPGAGSYEQDAPPTYYAYSERVGPDGLRPGGPDRSPASPAGSSPSGYAGDGGAPIYRAYSERVGPDALPGGPLGLPAGSDTDLGEIGRSDGGDPPATPGDGGGQAVYRPMLALPAGTTPTGQPGGVDGATAAYSAAAERLNAVLGDEFADRQYGIEEVCRDLWATGDPDAIALADRYMSALDDEHTDRYYLAEDLYTDLADRRGGES